MSDFTILDGFLLGLGWMLASALIAGLMMLVAYLVMRHHDKEEQDGIGRK